mmetsp:Transcript_29038/g.64107  ORF Transcript_29038/g.64107 Transcript_29038/m.64107 type:complete len:590 (-) Transcript_29038:210-1979(-)|eukprot:CAMPEP_0202890696 /NCGR_PEP_ID=MMETSP1392-20130828/1017_1 /ASSEMBLY_ACC=CAM_ASM_000868 /TAXON_ID=225041 /ORGANISM="Chlamydomonas chlamydogama, Strain SAG 11-48b" /LENGTH=589 /DNA_ID=CAMNT_0049574313 /DNA_START=152 /DNA_END=1921 /DNA_ORIENTATION=-
MSAGSRVAVILRSRAGKNLLIHTHGLELRQATQAAQDAALILEQLAFANDPGDISTSVQGLPLTCGKLRIWNGRWRVFYRILNDLLVMLLVPSTKNAFSALDMLAHVVRVVMSGSNNAEISLERLQRKYAEIYLAISTLVAAGGCSTAPEALFDARATLEGLSSSASGHKPSKATVKPKVTYGVAKRSLSKQVDQLTGLSFGSSSALSGIRPLPGFHVEQQQQQQQAAGPPRLAGGYQLPILQSQNSQQSVDPFALGNDSLVGGSAAAGGSKARSADPFEDIFGPITNAPIKPAAAGAAANGSWAAFDGTPAKAAAAPKPAAPMLRLREVWQGEVQGGRLVRCGLEGSVVWAADASSKAGMGVRAVEFSLQAMASGSEAVREGLRAARRHAMAVKEAAATAVFSADVMSASMVPAPELLRYHVHPEQGQAPPARVHFSATLHPLKDAQMMVVLGVRLMLGEHVQAQCNGVEVTMKVPPLFEQPVRAAPSGAQYDGKERQLSWKVQPPASGQVLVLAGAFLVSGSELACSAATKQATCKVVVKSSELAGPALAGVVLQQDVQAGTGQAEPTASWQARILAHPTVTTAKLE